jgi:hypothetical protein
MKKSRTTILLLLVITSFDCYSQGDIMTPSFTKLRTEIIEADATALALMFLYNEKLCNI